MGRSFGVGVPVLRWSPRMLDVRDARQPPFLPHDPYADVRDTALHGQSGRPDFLFASAAWSPCCRPSRTWVTEPGACSSATAPPLSFPRMRPKVVDRPRAPRGGALRTTWSVTVPRGIQYYARGQSFNPGRDAALLRQLDRALSARSGLKPPSLKRLSDFETSFATTLEYHPVLQFTCLSCSGRGLRHYQVVGLR